MVLYGFNFIHGDAVTVTNLYTLPHYESIEIYGLTYKITTMYKLWLTIISYFLTDIII